MQGMHTAVYHVTRLISTRTAKLEVLMKSYDRHNREQTGRHINIGTYSIVTLTTRQTVVLYKIGCFLW